MANIKQKKSSAALIDLEKYEVSAEVMTSDAVYKAELETVWKKNWLLLGHESEIARSGDHMTRYMGEDMVIVSRGRNDEIHVVLNACTHRGMAVCRTEMGRSNTFICPYHGWTFGLDGSLKMIPVGDQNMQGDIIAKEDLGLKKARVGVYCGLIFATFDEELPSLLDWLGDAAWYLKLMYGRTKSGMEVLGPPQRWIIEGNWKLAAEQFVGGDQYHVFTLHRSAFEMQLIGDASQIKADNAPSAMGADVWFPSGHTFRCSEMDYTPIFGEAAATMSDGDKLMAFPPPGMTPELAQEMLAMLDDDQRNILANNPPTVGGLFPNVGTHNFYFAHPDGGMLGAASGLHAFTPRGPDKLEWWNWQLVERDAPEELKERIAETCTIPTGPTGMLEADDGECWPFMQRVAKGALAAEGVTETIKYHALNGENRPSDWPASAGGTVSAGFCKDDGQWAFWQRYRELIKLGEGDE